MFISLKILKYLNYRPDYEYTPGIHFLQKLCYGEIEKSINGNALLIPKSKDIKFKNIFRKILNS